jgi:hypothetical protein
MNDLHFLPYLRRGLGRRLTFADPGSGALGPAELQAGVTVAGDPVTQTVGLLAPHRVASIDPAEIARRYPAPGAEDAEWSYFPLVEFRAPDLPWRYTPAGPGAKGRLRPWLILVAIDIDAPDIEYISDAGARGILRVQPGGVPQLPAPAEAWGWAHVQSSLPLDRVAESADNSPESFLSRLICPRRLEPGRAYRVALVNAFKAGAGERSEPAWTSNASTPFDLTVFDTWTFRTAAGRGDFEALCDRLEPDTKGGDLGIRAVEIATSGLKWKTSRAPAKIDFIGALADPFLITEKPPAAGAAFAQAVEPVLADSLGRAADAPDKASYNALRDDPVVGLPFYGSWPSNATRVPKSGWAREANLRPDRRIAAGLGARVVRRNQEELMAAAWDQLGSVREASDELNRGRLGAEIGRSWQERVARVEDGDRLGLAASLLAYVRVDGKPANSIVAGSLAPSVVTDRVWLRRTPRPRGASASKAYLKGTSPGASIKDRKAFGYQNVAQPQGVSPVEAELSVQDRPDGLFSAAAIGYAESAGLAARFGGQRLTDYLHRRLQPNPVPPGATRQKPFRATAAAAGVADAVAALDPLDSMRASLMARIPALRSLLPKGELPAAFQLAPRFLDALFWDLLRVDKDVLVPGLGDFPNNRIRLLAVNPGFVGAFLVGANHEMSREFLWREYPADLAATFFQRFFDYTNPDAFDIEPIDGWPALSNISANLKAAASTTVVLIRGDLIRRYPDVNIFVAPKNSEGEPDYRGAVQPSFEGRLGGDVLVVGFPLAPEIILASPPYFLVLEERTTAPRFGLDVKRDGRLTSWDNLAWIDFDDSALHVGATAIPGLGAPVFPGSAGGDVEWGRNAAHLAAALHQRPFRRLYPATRLIKQ